MPKSFVAGLTFILIVAITIVLSATMWSMGYTINLWVFPVSVVASLTIEYAVSRSFRLVIFTFICLLIALAVSGLLFDYTYDSNSYHKITVLYLADGWNPLQTSAYPETNPWTLHYAKLLEVFAAAVFSATGMLEQGKCINLILVVALLALSYDYLKSRRCTPRQILTLMLVAMCNPVLSTQLFTFYIDYTTYVYAVISIVLVCNIFNDRLTRMSYLLLFIVTLMAIGTKFNVFFYQGLLLLCVIIWCLFVKRYLIARNIVVLGLLCLVTGAAVFWHPYVTNALGWGNVFYPLLGEGAVDIMTKNTPLIYEGHGRLVNFFLSQITPCEGKGIFTVYDSRSAGFTLLSLPLLLFCAYLMIRDWGKWPKAAYFMIVMTLISCFVFQQSWWARYIPQLWLIPVVSVFCYLVYGEHNRAASASIIVLFLGVLILSFIPQSFMMINKTYQMHQIKEAISGRRIKILQPSESDVHILDKWGVDYIVVDSLQDVDTAVSVGHVPFWNLYKLDE